MSQLTLPLDNDTFISWISSDSSSMSTDFSHKLVNESLPFRSCAPALNYGCLSWMTVQCTVILRACGALLQPRRCFLWKGSALWVPFAVVAPPLLLPLYFRDLPFTWLKDSACCVHGSALPEQSGSDCHAGWLPLPPMQMSFARAGPLVCRDNALFICCCLHSSAGIHAYIAGRMRADYMPRI